MGWFSKEEPKAVELRTGARLKCTVCGCERFFERRAQLNTAAATFFNLDWANATAECWVCGQCGYVHWFLGT
jgi:predicted nucleic-acid-binding Zn-ribbon protein